MNSAELIAHVEESVAKALRKESEIDTPVLGFKGFSTDVQRHLVSNLCHLSKDEPVYVEAGLYGGASFFAATSNNPELTAFGIEDFSQDFGDPSIKDHLENNIETYKDSAKSTTIINSDFFKTDLALITKPVDIYYYDAHHDYEFQRDALPYFFDALADTFIWIVDDYAWDSVSTGTRDGLALLKDKLKVEKKWEFSDGCPDGKTWHNDVVLFVMSKI